MPTAKKKSVRPSTAPCRGYRPVPHGIDAPTHGAARVLQAARDVRADFHTSANVVKEMLKNTEPPLIGSDIYSLICDAHVPDMAMPPYDHGPI